MHLYYKSKQRLKEDKVKHDRTVKKAGEEKGKEERFQVLGSDSSSVTAVRHSPKKNFFFFFWWSLTRFKNNLSLKKGEEGESGGRRKKKKE